MIFLEYFERKFRYFLFVIKTFFKKEGKSQKHPCRVTRCTYTWKNLDNFNYQEFKNVFLLSSSGHFSLILKSKHYGNNLKKVSGYISQEGWSQFFFRELGWMIVLKKSSMSYIFLKIWIFNRSSQSVVFNSDQKMALLAVYVVLC